MEIKTLAENIENRQQDEPQTTQEGQEGAKANISAHETVKGQEGANNEATDTSEAVVIGVEKAAGEDWTQYTDILEDALAKYSVERGISTEESRKESQKIKVNLEAIAESFGKALTILWEGIKQSFEAIREALKALNLDKWKLQKLEMPNNERRRRGMQMVRRRTHIQNEKNSRKRKRKR